MFDPSDFSESLNSFFNLSKAVIRLSNELSTQKLESIVGITRESIRGRMRNPLLWRISEIKLMAEYYRLSPRICVQMYCVVPGLISYLEQLPTNDRKKVERLCQVTMKLLVNRLNYDLTIADLMKIHKGLSQLK